MAIIISILAGVSIVVARIINSNLANKIGILESTFFNYVVGLIFGVLFLIISGEFLNVSLSNFNNVPIWAYLGGLVGIIVVALSSFVTPKTSAFYLTLIIFIGQLFTGIIIDYIRLGKVSIGNFVGGILVILGLTYNLMIDKKSSNGNDTIIVDNENLE